MSDQIKIRLVPVTDGDAESLKEAVRVLNQFAALLGDDEWRQPTRDRLWQLKERVSYHSDLYTIPMPVSRSGEPLIDLNEEQS